MERRKQARIQPSELIEVAVLGEGHACMAGRIVDVSLHGLGLRLPASLPIGTAIKIEAGDELVLGEVSDCAPQNGGFRVGLAVKHRLPGLAQLHRLNRALHESEQPVSQLQGVSSIMER